MSDVKKKTEQYTHSAAELHDTYNRLHPQVLSKFEDEMDKYWGREWKANTTVGKLNTVLLHRPGNEFLSVGNPTPWPPYESSWAAWRMTEKPNLDELIEHHENLVDSFKAEGIEIIIRKPDHWDPPYTVKSIYCDDVAHAAVYGHVILRMYDNIRKGEELPTFQTLAEHGIPVVGTIFGDGMVEGGSGAWLCLQTKLGRPK